jgi:hypothetical protein
VTEPTRITEHAHDDAHVAEGLALLTSRLRGKPAIEAFLSSVLEQVQEVEDALWSLYGLAIDDSSDVALDQIGAVLGQPRPDGMDDTTYRLVLGGVVVALTSSGTGDDLLRATHALLGSWDFSLTEAFPAAVLIEPDAHPSVPAAVIHAVLRRVKSGGVGLQVIDVPSGDLFTLSSSVELEEDDADRGFSDTDRAAGGLLVGVIE